MLSASPWSQHTQPVLDWFKYKLTKNEFAVIKYLNLSTFSLMVLSCVAHGLLVSSPDHTLKGLYSIAPDHTLKGLYSIAPDHTLKGLYSIVQYSLIPRPQYIAVSSPDHSTVQYSPQTTVSSQDHSLIPRPR